MVIAITFTETDVEAAFARDLVSARAAVLKAAYKHAGNTADAEDLTQSVMARAWMSRGTYKGCTGDAKGVFVWLHTILSNICRDRWRRQQSLKRRRALTVSLDALSEDGRDLLDKIAATEPTPEAALVSTSERERMERVISELPYTGARMLWLYGVEGRGYADIAAVLGVPVGTVRSGIARARAALRRELETQEDTT